MAYATAKDGKDNDKRPKITLKAQPIISMAPSKVTLRAELVGGANDYEEFYCPTIEWDWDDGTMSESTSRRRRAAGSLKTSSLPKPHPKCFCRLG